MGEINLKILYPKRGFWIIGVTNNPAPSLLNGKQIVTISFMWDAKEVKYLIAGVEQTQYLLYLNFSVN